VLPYRKGFKRNAGSVYLVCWTRVFARGLRSNLLYVGNTSAVGHVESVVAWAEAQVFRAYDNVVGTQKYRLKGFTLVS